MPKLRKQPVTGQSAFERLSGLMWDHGYDFWLGKDAPRLLARAGLTDQDVTPGLLRQAEAACRQRLTEPMVAANADPHGRLRFLYDGHPVLDPELNPDHPVPGRAKREAEVQANEIASRNARFAVLKEARATVRGPSPQGMPPAPKPTPPPTVAAGRVAVVGARKML